MTQPKPIAITRRKLLLAGAAVPLCAILTRPAAAAEFTYKLATGQDPTHPVNVRAKEAADRIREATSGRLEINLFPANQLGSDTDLLTQVRNGSVEFFNLSSLILATLVPAAGIVNLGFLFPNYDAVWKAMDGDLGAYIRAQIAKTPIMTVSKPWDNGFRHITSSGREIKTPDDLKGFKLRVPAGTESDFVVPCPWSRSGTDQLQRGLFRAADQSRRRSGKSPSDHCDGAPV